MIAAVALGFVGLASAQTTIAPQAGNYAITDALPGDQARPALALGSGGGFFGLGG